MSTIKPQCRLESVAIEALRDRGWTVTGGRRSGVDLDLDVELHGTHGNVRFRNAFESARGAASGEPEPIFLRVDLGEPSGDPERWAGCSPKANDNPLPLKHGIAAT